MAVEFRWGPGTLGQLTVGECGERTMQFCKFDTGMQVTWL